jgi:tRNA-dihydrouridine synthase C
MEGVTDAPMRALLGEMGGFSFCVAEFLRISQQVLQPKGLFKHVPEVLTANRTASGLPVQVQLLGGDPERLAQSAQVAVQAGACAIDLNFGCPARTVNRHDGGASLLRHPQRLGGLVRAVRQALPAAIPVSVKLRLGWDDPAAIYQNAEIAADAGASWLTVHARTREQGYRPPAHWSYIGAIRRQLSLPIVANGDILTVEDFLRCRDVTGCEHFMLGRGAVADPLLARRVAAALGIAPGCLAEPMLGWHRRMQRFVELALAAGSSPQRLVGRLKQWAKMAQGQLPELAYESIKRLSTPDSVIEALRAYETTKL